MKKAFTQNSRLLVIFYFLIAYIILQFIWWGFHIINLTKQLNNDQDYLYRRVLMIAGEAAVFIIIISIGAIYVVRSFRKEIKLSQRQKNFTLSVTHELKTPIASSKLFLETLINRSLPEEKKKELLKKVLLDQERLQNLVENILMASHISEKNLELIISELSLFDLVNSVQKDFPATHPVRNEIDPKLKIKVDEFYFISVLQNLFENAQKYSPKGSEIVWKSHEHHGKVAFSIRDQGSGIPVNERKKVFDMFYRLDSEETRTSKGTGLGLYLVDNIIKLHKGEISVTNYSEGCELMIKI
ncbi:MAG: sensor histidine kinase [Parvicellaceae bacterium]